MGDRHGKKAIVVTRIRNPNREGVAMSPLFWILLGALATLVILRWVVPNPQAIKFVEANNIPRELLIVTVVLLGAFILMTQLTLLRSIWPAYLELPSRLAWWVWVLLAVDVVLGAVGLIGWLLRKRSKPSPSAN